MPMELVAPVLLAKGAALKGGTSFLSGGAAGMNAAGALGGLGGLAALTPAGGKSDTHIILAH